MKLFYDYSHPEQKEQMNREWGQLKKELRQPIARQVILFKQCMKEISLLEDSEKEEPHNNNIETIEYGEILNSTILKLFGNEMTFNELKFYTRDEESTTYLKVEFNRNKDYENQLVRVWFDEQLVMCKKYSYYYSSDMFHYLNELENELKDDDEEDD